jgi:Fe-S cluster biogenesis protein NfuA
MLQETELRAALEEVTVLVRADGGDLDLVGFDDAAGAVTLRLHVESASCAECILPRPLLEDIAGGILRRSVPAITQVTIDDPREHPDFVAPSH